MKRNILIGGAWPYANSSLHLGHIAGLISGDLLARYYRLKGDNVLYVSGSDCHGTPITERAKKEKTTPIEIASKYDEEFNRMFNGYQFSYDLYSRTFDGYHKEKVQELYQDKLSWQRMCLMNVANSGFFTSDRTIESYVKEIWKLNKVC